MGLQRARDARVPTSKLPGYALDLAHERGRRKARVFARIAPSDWHGNAARFTWLSMVR
jgi:hypothetical protein